MSWRLLRKIEDNDGDKTKKLSFLFFKPTIEHKQNRENKCSFAEYN